MSVPVSFGTYEVFRMILPGFFATGLIFAFAFFFLPTREEFISILQHPAFSYMTVVLGIFSGLLLYAFDYPKRTRFWKEQLVPRMPSLHLKEILCDSCATSCKNRIKGTSKTIDTYFYVLHRIFDPSSRAKIFYFGSIYHAFADVRALSGIFGLAIPVVSISGFLWKNGLPLFDAALGFALGLTLFALWMSLHPEFSCTRNLSKGDKYMLDALSFQRRYLDLHIDQVKQELCKPQLSISETSYAI